MTLSQIKYFLAVCEQKSFTNAARRCAVSQPSLTNAIKALENELGSTLFNRKPQAQPTTVGRALQPYFQSIIEAADKTREVAQRIRERNT
jgi:LysR family transcriptional regulator, hydrogen peroxide-inducible genes activator